MELFHLTSQYDGLPLEAAWRRADCPRAVLQIVHGMAEHKERYEPFMDFLAEHGIVSVIDDHRGHGASVADPSDLGYFGENGADALLSDLHQITETAKAEYPGLPVFLLGHSMGALAVRALIQQYGADFKGLIVSGNPGYSSFAPTAVKIAQKAQKKDQHARSRFLTLGIFVPFILGSGSFYSRNAWISTDRKVVEAYDADPLCGFEFYANGYEALMNLMIRACAKDAPAPNPALPVLFLSGEKDPCMAGKGRLFEAAELLKQAGYTDVDVKLYPGMRHEILNEPEKQTVYRDMLDAVNRWMA